MAFDSSALGMFFALFGSLLVIPLLWHLLNAVPLFLIARRRGIRLGWLAWLPIGQDYVLGAVADNAGIHMTSRFYSGALGRIINEYLRFILPGYKIVTVLVWVFQFLGLFQGLAGAFTGGGADWSTVQMEIVFFISFVMSGLNALAIYKIFDIYKPSRASLFTVLCVFFAFLRPFFLLYCCKIVRSRKVIRYEDYFPPNPPAGQ